MKEAITLEIINKRIPVDKDLVEQEYLVSRVGEKRLDKYKMLEKEIKELEFHVSRFACEGANLRRINQYRVLIDYVNLLYKHEEYYKCAKVSTVLKLFFGLDVSFLTMLPELKGEIEQRGPIYFQTLVDTARRYVKNRGR